MTTTNQPRNDVSAGWLIAGLLLGFLFGGVVALLRVPRSGTATRQQVAQTAETVRSRVEAVIPSDAIADGLADGKAAARRRRSELGLNT